MESDMKVEKPGLIYRLKSKFPQKGFARSVLLLAGGTALSQGLAVLVSPVLTRLYTPGEFGMLAIYISILAPLVVISTWRYESAIPLPEDEGMAANLLVLSLSILIGMTFLSGLVLWLFGDIVVQRLSVPTLHRYLWLLPLSLFGAGAYQTLFSWGLRKRAFYRITRTKLNQSLGQIITQVITGLTYPGPIGLLVGDAVGRMGGSSTLATMVWKQDKAALKEVSVSGVKKVAVRYRRFPFISCGSALLNSLGLQIPPLLLAAFYGPQVAGWFALGQRVLGVPLSLLGASVAQVFLAESARISNSLESMRILFGKTMRNMILIGLPFVLVIVFTSPWLFKLIFGIKWVEAGVYLQVLALMLFLQFLAGSVGGALDVMERQDLHLVREILRISLMTVAVILAGYMKVKPVIAIVYLSISGSVTYLFSIYIAWHAIKKKGQGQLNQ